MNKVRFNLKNAFTSKITEGPDSITFGIPEALRGAVSISLDPEGESKPFHADGIVYYTSSSNNGYAVELELALIPDDFKLKYLCYRKSDKGLVVEDASIQPKPFAFLFQFDGDEKAIKHILFKCMAQRFSQEGKTNEDTADPATEKLPIVCTPLEVDDNLLVKANTAADTDKKEYDDFFKIAPVLPTFTEVPPTESGDQQ